MGAAEGLHPFELMSISPSISEVVEVVTVPLAPEAQTLANLVLDTP